MWPSEPAVTHALSQKSKAGGTQTHTYMHAAIRDDSARQTVEQHLFICSTSHACIAYLYILELLIFVLVFIVQNILYLSFLLYLKYALMLLFTANLSLYCKKK